MGWAAVPTPSIPPHQFWIRHCQTHSAGLADCVPIRNYSRTVRNRRALPITATELNAMAAPAMIGLSNKPKLG